MGYKYRSKPTIVDGIRFPSKKEANRYKDLKLLEALGEISDLELQPRFPLVVLGVKLCTYVSDFKYRDKKHGMDIPTVEEVKGYKTREYIIKAKLFRILYPQYVFIES